MIKSSRFYSEKANMRNLLVLLLTFGHLVHAELKEFPELLSYQKLEALTPARRMAYINHIRQMLLEVSQMRGGLIADVDFEDQNEPHSVAINQFLEFWNGLTFLPQADAASVTCNDPNYPFSLGNLCGALCADRGPSTSEVGQAVNNHYFCFPKTAYNSLPTAQKRSLNLNPGDAKALASVDRGDLTQSQRQANLQKAQSDKSLQVQTRIQMTNDQASQAAAMRVSIAETDKITAAQKSAAETARANIAQSDKMEADQASAAQTARANIAQSDKMEADQASAAQTARANIASEDQAVAQKKAEDAKAEAQKADDTKKGVVGKGGGVCAKPTLSCDGDAKSNYNKQKKDALKSFRSSSPTNCISSGNMSKYKDGQVKANNCAQVRDFCIKPDDCNHAAKATDNGFMSKYSCSADQVICSPFVYGLESKTKAVCVSGKGQHLTEACDKKAAQLEKKPGYIKDFLGQAPAGVAEAWNDYATGFNSSCKQNSVSIDAHCEECGLIGKRLKEGHRLATGTCDDALDYQQIQSHQNGDAGSGK